MPPKTVNSLNKGRAILTFALAYIAVTILGIALSLSISAIGHIPQTAEPMQNAAYLLSERFLPIMNLLVWMLFSWMYFQKRPRISTSHRQAFFLGAFWLLVALVVDYVGFVLIKNPISLSPHDFYIGQFPWIYLIYIAVLISPLCYVALSDARQKKHLA